MPPLCVSPSDSAICTQQKPCSSLAVRMAAVLLSGKRRRKEGKERQEEKMD